MNAGDLVLTIRNPRNDGFDVVEVPMQKGSNLYVNQNGIPACKLPVGGTPTALATAGAGTYLTAAILSGMIQRDCAGASRTDTTDTAANLIAGIASLSVDYGEFSFYVVNTSSGAYTITLAGGTGVTLQGIGTIAQNSMDEFKLFRTSGTTLVMRKA